MNYYCLNCLKRFHTDEGISNVAGCPFCHSDEVEPDVEEKIGEDEPDEEDDDLDEEEEDFNGTNGFDGEFDDDIDELDDDDDDDELT